MEEKMYFLKSFVCGCGCYFKEAGRVTKNEDHCVGRFVLTNVLRENVSQEPSIANHLSTAIGG